MGVPNAVLDFGPVAELSTATLDLKIENSGRAALHVKAALDAASSKDFSFATPPAEIAPGASGVLKVTFAPVGAGSDAGTLLLTADDPQHTEAKVTLKGGPIGPAITLGPDPLDFAPAAGPLVTKRAVIRSTGLSTLTVRAVGVAVGGNPDFSVRPPTLPATLKPGEEFQVDVDYARSSRHEHGRLEVHSDDPRDTVYLELLPDPLKACADGIDNDGDGLIDFPDDPGCTGPDDDDESNPPECLAGATQPCGSSVGACKMGNRTCAHSVWGPCDGAVAPTAEVCDGIDNDCNGRTDDGISAACAVFTCAGTKSCVENSGVAGGQWSACVPSASGPEVCNNADDDCNGAIDDGLTQACYTGSAATRNVGRCHDGSQQCSAGSWLACSGEVLPTAETCNGIDDNCDGQIDENLTLPCYTGAGGTENVGACHGGTQTCTTGAWSGCVGQVVPGGEVCNGVDDDCNGQIDDGIAPRACYGGPGGTRGVGACHDGAQSCSAGTWGGCSGDQRPAAETCNNVDDNCDGLIDNGIAPITCYTGPPATRNVGACHDGSQTCSAGSWGSCTGQVIPVAEICGNGIDDNCDGQVDEGCGGNACAWPPTTALDAYEPNNSGPGLSTGNPSVTTTANSTFSQSYNMTLTSADLNDWSRFVIPTTGAPPKNTQMRAEITCLNWAAAGCSGNPMVGIELWYDDSLQDGIIGPSLDTSNNGTSGLAVVVSSGPINGAYAPQVWIVHTYPSSVVCAGNAIDYTLKITVTNN